MRQHKAALQIINGKKENAYIPSLLPLMGTQHRNLVRNFVILNHSPAPSLQFLGSESSEAVELPASLKIQPSVKINSHSWRKIKVVELFPHCVPLLVGLLWNNAATSKMSNVNVSAFGHLMHSPRPSANFFTRVSLIFFMCDMSIISFSWSAVINEPLQLWLWNGIKKNQLSPGNLFEL